MSLRLTKTDIHPLKSMGRCPAAMLPFLSYKSKLLTSKTKAWQHRLPEGLHPLQGDKQEINISLEECCTQSRLQKQPHMMFTLKQCACYEKVFIFCLSPCGWCKARRVMVEQAENIWARSRIFRRLRHPWLAETFASTARGLYWFLSIRTATNNVSWKEHTTLLCLFNDNILICLTAVLPLCRTLLFLNLLGMICRNRQKNINFANDNEDAVSCGSVKQRQREETMKLMSTADNRQCANNDDALPYLH